MSTRGLRDVVVAETAVSDIDGENGVLWYAGYDIKELAAHSSFEETFYLLHFHELPNARQLDELSAQLVKERDLDDLTRQLLPTMAREASPMSMLRTLVSASSAFDPDGWESPDNDEANLRKAIRLTARIPQMVGGYLRLRRGEPLGNPDPGLGHAANFLFGLTGEVPSEEDARILDLCLVLHADHTMNASTFAARVTAATLSDMHSAITSAIGTLKGSLHGGANERVFEMLEEVAIPEAAEAAILERLGRKERIMGFGHAVYRTEDPRATILRELARQISERKGQPHWYEISERIEEAVRREKGLYPNVDFYAATVYHCLGIPTELFTPVFAASRVAGWTAQVREQYANNRLIRPDSVYVGPAPGPYVPLRERT
ncbi:MAG: citrate/2-methylcitrate synthase [Actinomycetota bacterium]